MTWRARLLILAAGAGVLGATAASLLWQRPLPVTERGTERLLAPPEGVVWPDDAWRRLARPEDAGWSSTQLERARALAEQLGSDAVLITQDGLVVQQWGEVDVRLPVYSIRKSLLGALIGQAVDAGAIALDGTLAAFGIDDSNPPLTAAEKSATVRDLLTGRSGVYHRAAYESSVFASQRPAAGSHRPGTFFYYNNWDFNALGTIYMRATGRDLFGDFEARIARPIGMQDFSLDATAYRRESSSDHPAYLFEMSARDLARFGLLYLREGEWRGERIVPAGWVRESTRAHVRDATENRSYGYLWWTYPRFGRYYGASGSGGQHVVVDVDRRIVVVHLARENVLGRGGVGTADFWRLYGLIVAAAPPAGR